jgi:hypothetical protein
MAFGNGVYHAMCTHKKECVMQISYRTALLSSLLGLALVVAMQAYSGLTCYEQTWDVLLTNIGIFVMVPLIPALHRLVHPQSLECFGRFFGFSALAHLRLLCGLHDTAHRCRRRIVNLCGGVFIRRRQLLARGIVRGGIDVVDASESGEGQSRPQISILRIERHKQAACKHLQAAFSCD